MSLPPGSRLGPFEVTALLGEGGMGQVYRSAYDVHPDGTRVATSVRLDQASVVQDKVVFVFNFGDYLRTIAPGIK